MIVDFPTSQLPVPAKQVMGFDDVGEARQFISDMIQHDPLGLGYPLRLVLPPAGSQLPPYLVAPPEDARQLVKAGYQYGSVPLDVYATHTLHHFSDGQQAADFVQLSREPLRVVLGDIDKDGENPDWLVATPVDADRLVRLGYEYGDSVLGLEEPGLTL